MCLNTAEREQNYYKSHNEGNFLGLLKLLSTENSDLMNYLSKCKEGMKITLLGNKFTSKVLDVTRSHIVRKIVNQIVNDGGKFGLCVDTTTDLSGVHQASVVVRYLASTGADSPKVIEDTIAILECKHTSGEGIFLAIKALFDEIGLDMKNIIGCSFDGAANMRSEKVGVVYYLRLLNQLLVYTWCFAHRFNIVISNSCKVSLRIRSSLQLAEEAAAFLRASYKRMDIWVTVAKNVPGYNSKTRLILIGQTRWTSKGNAISHIVKSEYHLFVIIRCFAEICNIDSLDNKALTTACNIFRAWTAYDNVLFTYLLHKVFSVLTPVTKSLQEYGLNLIDAMNSIKRAYAQLSKIDRNLDTYINEAHVMISKVNQLIEGDPFLQSTGSIKVPSEPEKAKIIQTALSDISSFVNNIKTSIENLFLSEFDDENLLYKEISLLDLKYLSEELNVNNTISLKSLSKSIGLENDLILVEELKAFLDEFKKHQREWSTITTGSGRFAPAQSSGVSRESSARYQTFLGENVDDMSMQDENTADTIPLLIESYDDLEDAESFNNNSFIRTDSACYCVECILEFIDSNTTNKEKFKNVSEAYRFVAMLPSTQVKCERDFSRLRFTKNRLRTSLGQEQLQNLMIISLANKWLSVINLEDIIDEVALTSKKGREMM